MKQTRENLVSLPHSPSTSSRGRRSWILIRDAVPYLLAFATAVTLVVCLLRWHINRSYEEEMLFWQARLTSVADDQALRVSDWIKERQGDARVASSRPSLHAVLRAYGKSGQVSKFPSSTQMDRISALDEIATSYSYTGVYILDRNAHVVMQSSHSIPLNPLLAASCRAVALSGVARDELAGDTPSRTLMGFIAPMFPDPAATDPGQPAGQPLGSVLLVSDASRSLFPIVTREVIPSRTGETVLVRREGEGVVYFSPLRNKPTNSPIPRIPLSTAPVPARLALEGRTAFVQFNDYRGVPVLAATQNIPLKGWGLVRKLDRAEALKDFHHGALLECLAGAILIALLSSLLLILRRYIITQERERTQHELRRLNRALLTISACNQVLVRAEKECDLLSQVCETLVRVGDYRMAWVGYAENDEAKSVRPVSQSGLEEGYLQAANITWAETERGQGPTGRAIRNGKVQVARNIQTDPSFAPWREEARKHGYASSMALPLFLDGQVLGALMVYAEAPDAFDSAEVALLTQLVNDLAFGIQALRTRVEQQRAEEALLHEKAFTESIIDSLPDSFFIIDSTGRYVNWNKNAGKALGYSAEEFADLDPLSHVLEGERPLAASKMQEALTNGSASGDFKLLAKDGRKIPYLMTATRAVIDDKIYLIGIGVDITERKLAEESVALLKHSIDIHYDGAYWTDVENRFIYINGVGCKSLGYAPEELIGKTILEVNPKASPQDLGRVWETLRRQGFFSTESVHRRKDGSEFPVEIVTTYVQFGGREFSCGFARDITARKRADAALTEERLLLHTLMDNLPDKIYFKDHESRFTRINLALAEGFGLSDPSKAVGLTDFDFYLPEHAQLAYEDEQEITRTGHSMVGKEEKEVWRDGHVTWVSTTKMPLRNASGNVIGTFGVSHDITNRRRAQEALIESEGKYRSLISNIPDVVWTLDAGLRFVFISKNIEKISGYSFAEVCQNGSDLYLASIHVDDVHKVKDGLHALFAEGRPYDVECRVRHRLGNWIWVHDRAHATYEKDGIRYADGLLSDITERKRAEEEILLKTALLEAQSETAIDGILVVDDEDHIILANKQFGLNFGIPDDVLATSDDLIVRKYVMDRVEDPSDFVEKVKYLNSDRHEKSRDELKFKNGNIYDRYSAPLVDSKGRYRGRIWYFRDITERKSLEAQLQQATKMEAVGKLAGGVAHDFNNLLTVINGYSEILLEHLASDTKASAYLRAINDAGGRAASLTRQLLAFSRHQVLSPQVLDLNVVVSNLEKMLRRLIGEDVRLHTLLHPSLARVKADPGQIEQVIMNLAVNARDAMPTGGSLAIETSNVELDEEYARNHPTVKPGPHVVLVVSDTGEGMTPETQARIFEPFFTTKEMGKGTGLGLATVYGIVKQSGGSVWVYSEVGKGTTFKVYFPVVTDGSAVKESPILKADSASGTETVLVVEDEEGVRSLVRLALVSGGYTVLESPNPESALGICSSHDGPIHLLLTDVVMPQMSGPDVASKVAALRPGIRVLFMSGYTDDAVVHHGVLTQEMPFIQKPFSPNALRKKIREVLGRK